MRSPAAIAADELTPWYRVPGDYDLEQGVMRKCLNIACLGASAIVPTTTDEPPVKHKDGCGVQVVLQMLTRPSEMTVRGYLHHDMRPEMPRSPAALADQEEETP